MYDDLKRLPSLKGSLFLWGKVMNILLLVNGELYRPDILRNRIHAEAFDMVLGTDGGARHAKTLDVRVDAIIGDMDSLHDTETQNKINAELISYPAEKDETDLELALLYAKDKGAEKIVMVGAIGGRMDMTISNILLMTNESLSSCRVEAWHGKQTGWIIKPPGEDIYGSSGDTLSLIPLGEYASGVTTTRLKYPLKEATLYPGKARGLSNILEESTTHVAISEGLLLATHTPGRA